MCDVRPFCGLRYNLQQITDPSTVVTPPYDVISPEERSIYYHISPYNIIRLEFGEERPEDSPGNNKYTRAAAALNDWQRSGVLIREKRPAFYIIEHRFPYHDADRSRWGLIARVRLEEFDGGHIHPHEKTNKEPAVDRLHLLRACHANISPVMGLVRTEQGEMAGILRETGNRPPDMSAADNYGVRYNLWTADDEKVIDRVAALLAVRDICIADGHHRYETALRYRKERQADNPTQNGDEPYNFVMMSLMDSQDPGLVMLPTHRLVHGVEPQKIALLEEAISPYFAVEELLPPPSPAIHDTVQEWLRILERHGREGIALGMFGRHGGKLCILRLRKDADLRRLMSEEELRLWKDLDVVLLQRIVMQTALGIRTLDEETRHLDYNRDAVEVKSRVDSGKYQLAFLLNPAPVARIMDTAAAGKRLPQKSTYFYPKTPAGLVLNPLWD